MEDKNIEVSFKKKIDEVTVPNTSKNIYLWTFGVIIIVGVFVNIVYLFKKNKITLMHKRIRKK